MRALFYTLTLLTFNGLNAQAMISGKVSDAVTGKILSEANVTVQGTSLGDATDTNGFYILSLPVAIDSVITLIVYYLGYQRASIKMIVRRGDSLVQDVMLSKNPLELPAVKVTAKRIEENLQDVPIATTVITSDELQNRTVNTTLEALSGIPNLIYDDILPSFATISIRGLSTNNLDNVGFEGGVGLYVDDVYFSRPFGFNATLLDAERIEVLRGPQGTLFGKNTIGGVVHIISQKPQMRNYGMVEIAPGNYTSLLSRGKINTEVVKNKMALSLAGVYNRMNGWIFDKNPLTSETNNTAFRGLRGALLWEPNERIEILGRGYYGKDGNALNTVEYKGKADGSPFPGVDIDYKDRAVETDAKYSFARKQYGFSGHLNMALRTHTLSSITSYNRDEDELNNDSDFTRFNALTFGHRQAFKTFSQELKLSTPGEPKLSYTAGLYYLREEIAGRDSTGVGPDIFQLFGLSVDEFFEAATANGIIKSNSFAVYLSGTYSLNEQWGLNAGFRYTIEKKDLDYWQRVITFPDPDLSVIHLAATPLPVPGSADPTLNREANDEAPSGNLGLDYQVSEDVLTYAKFSRGFKGSGFSIVNVADSTGGELVFEPEYLNSLELGVKSMLVQRRVRLNASVFYQVYQNKQEALVVDVRNLVANADRVEGFGAEFELDALMAKGLQANLSVGYLNLEYKEFVFAGDNLAGNRLQKAPEWTIGFAPQYSAIISSGIRFLSRLHIYHTGRSYSDPFNTEVIARDPVTLVDGRVAISFHDERYSIALWGKNLTDEVFVQHGWEFDWGDQVVINPPRMFGLEVRASVY